MVATAADAATAMPDGGANVGGPSQPTAPNDANDADGGARAPRSAPPAPLEPVPMIPGFMPTPIETQASAATPRHAPPGAAAGFAVHRDPAGNTEAPASARFPIADSPLTAPAAAP